MHGFNSMDPERNTMQITKKVINVILRLYIYIYMLLQLKELIYRNTKQLLRCYGCGLLE